MQIFKSETSELLSLSGAFASCDNPVQQFCEGVLSYWKGDGLKQICIACEGLGALEGVKRVLLEYGLRADAVQHAADIPSRASGASGAFGASGATGSALPARAESDDRRVVYLAVLNLKDGFETADAVFVSAQKVFGRKVAQLKSRRKAAPNLKKARLQASNFEIGDLVTHSEHGVGIFEGMEAVVTAGKRHEMVKLRYRDGNVLFVPVYMMGQISKYSQDGAALSLDEKESLLSGLSGKSWHTKRERVKRNLLEIAHEIVKVVAIRKSKPAPKFFGIPGVAEEFFMRFPFATTDDQQAAIDDIFEDLSGGAPMDRLICGDVGYGKTEVAMRAAFIVTHGKYFNSNNKKGADGGPEKNATDEGEEYKYGQVVIVVPTTILARQHFKNFLERFEGTEIKIAELSRGVSARHKESILKGVESGDIDILIGTHAAFSSKLKFKKLALLVIDEEQHFGVKQKEKLKQSGSGLHALMLSATPIPRTLQMSLSGLRDISLITTPPFDRLAPYSFLIPFDGVVISQAVARERARGGRVFFVCPRIRDIEEQRERLEQLLEGMGVRMVIAHGGMPPSDVDDAMVAFFEGRYDLLLTTNIVESGVDISFANTIFIYNAQMFGLASLHQLRGRVGRSGVQSYAYFVVEEHKMKNANVLYRMKSLLNASALGSGFKVATVDMDIRGAGNVLGKEQSGYINEVGVELYQEMLSQAIDKVKHGDAQGRPDKEWVPEVKVGSSVYIPDEYIEDLGTRMGFYRRIAAISSHEELEELVCEMADRFGPIPQSINNLFDVMDIKVMCSKYSITRIEATASGARVEVHPDEFKGFEALLALGASGKGEIILCPDSSVLVKAAHEDPIARVRGVVCTIAKCCEG